MNIKVDKSVKGLAIALLVSLLLMTPMVQSKSALENIYEMFLTFSLVLSALVFFTENIVETKLFNFLLENFLRAYFSNSKLKICISYWVILNFIFLLAPLTETIFDSVLMGMVFYSFGLFITCIFQKIVTKE